MITNGPRVVAVLETDPTGHRLHYIRHLLDAAGAAEGSARCVVLTTPSVLHSAEYAVHSASLAASTLVLPAAEGPRALLASAVALARTVGARTLVLPGGDRYLLSLLLLLVRRPRLPLDIRVLLMRTPTVGGPERLRPSMIGKPVLAQLLRIFRRVHVLFLTDALGVVTRRTGYPGITAVPDPVQRTDGAMPPRPCWFPSADPAVTFVGIFGVLSPRKNLPLLVRAAALVPEMVLVLGGRLEPPVRAFVEVDQGVRALVAEGRMVIVDRLLTEEELGAALAAVDVVAVLHDNDAPSGILAEACLRHTPVLVPSGGWLARVAESTGVGAATPLTVSSVAEAVRLLGSNPSAYVEATHRQAPRINTVGFVDRMLGV